MAVSFVAASEDSRGTTNTVVPTPPSGYQSGDLLLAIHASDRRGALSSMTAPSGWSLVSGGSTSRSDVGFVKVWQKTATGSEPSTYSFPDSTSAHCDVVIVALRGHDPSQPLLVSPTWANGASATTHPASSVTGAAGAVLITAHIAGTNGTTRSYTSGPSGMTLAQDATLSSGGYILENVYYQALSGSGATGGKTATCSAATPYITMALVVQQPSSQTVLPSGISSVSVFGTPSVSSNDGEQTVNALGVASAQALGAPTVSLVGGLGPYPGAGIYPGSDIYPGDTPPAPQDQTVTLAALGSAEAFGSPVLSVADGDQAVLLSGIDSGETFPVPEVILDPLPPQTIQTVGVLTEEAFGRPSLALEIPVPTATGVDAYYIDGVPLTDYAWAVEVMEGLVQTPVLVGDDVALPGRDGELVVYGEQGQPRRADGPGRIVFNMWLIGGDHETGYVPDGSTTEKEWVDRWDELVRLVYRRRVTIDHARSDNTVRRATGHLVPDETIEPNRYPGSPSFARLRASFVIPSGHWTDISPVTTGPLALTTNGFVDLSTFADATAPCTELQVVFGPGNNPRLATSTGYVGWNGVIPAGRQLGIDTGTGYTHQASGAAWTPGFDNLTYGPGPRVFEVDPSEPLQAVFTHTTGVGMTMTVEITGKRHYRTS